MTNIASLLATLGLVFVTAILAYVTYTLKKATDHLARVQILPKLVLARSCYLLEAGGPAFAEIKNKGNGAAFKTNAFATSAQGVRFALEEKSVGVAGKPLTYRTISPEESVVYTIGGAVGGLPLGIEIEYEDAEGHPYKEKIVTRTPTTPSGTA